MSVAAAPPDDDSVVPKTYDRVLLRRLLRYLRPYGASVAAALGLIIAQSGLDLVSPYLTKVAIDRHIAGHDAPGLSRVALLFLLTLGAAWLVRYLQNQIMQMTGQRIMQDMRRDIYAHLQQLHVGYFDHNPVGRLMTRVTTDVDAVNELFTSGVVTVFGDLFALVGIMIVMLGLDFRLALVTFSVIPLFFLLTDWFRRGARASFRETRRWARINAFLQESLTGMAVVQLFRREAKSREEFASINRRHADANLRAIFYYAVFYPAIELLAALAAALILVRGGGLVLRGALTLGILVAFIQYSERFWRPISDLSEKFNILQGAMAASERIFGLLDTPSLIASPGQPHSPAEIAGAVRFEAVWFSYRAATQPDLGPRAASEAGFTPAQREASEVRVADGTGADRTSDVSKGGLGGAAQPDLGPRAASEAGFTPAQRAGGLGGATQPPPEQWILRDIDFAVEAGKSVALVGATGAGKTSVISLLMRFYDPQRGRILLDGVDVRQWSLASLRSSAALVLQDVHLFSGTIASNIRLGSRIPIERVRAAAEAVHAHRFIERLPHGYETEVRERGTSLSVGQKQLLSFARALAHDPKLLILDEATSSVDTETEQLIQDALRVLMAGRTAIVVAHRLSTVQYVDEILVLHKGRIRERGTHQELLSRRGTYWRLYQLQYEQQEGATGPAEAEGLQAGSP